VYKPLPPGVYPIAVDKYINNQAMESKHVTERIIIFIKLCFEGLFIYLS
jgi:hypothetical protein